MILLSIRANAAKLQGWDYSQSAITLTVEHELPHDGTAEEHFTPTGVFAVLPLVGNRSSLVWTDTHDRAKKLCALPDDQFLVELEHKFGSHRGKLTLASARHVYPLSMKLAPRSIVGLLNRWPAAKSNTRKSPRLRL